MTKPRGTPESENEHIHITVVHNNDDSVMQIKQIHWILYCMSLFIYIILGQYPFQKLCLWLFHIDYHLSTDVTDYRFTD